MNTGHTKSVMKHSHWMIHTITYKGVRGKHYRCTEVLRNNRMSQEVQLVKGMGIGYGRQ